MELINIPSGYKFLPTDKELIQYLLCKAKEEELPCEDVVKDCDVYGKEPSELFEGSEEKVLYFFTRLKKKHENGSRIECVTETMGTWKGQDKAKLIKDMDGSNFGTEEEEETAVVIGGKRSLTYRMKSDAKAAKSTGWSMTQYNLEGTILKQAKVKDYVICRIKRQKQEGKVIEGKVISMETKGKVISMEPEQKVISMEPEKKVIAMEPEQKVISMEAEQKVISVEAEQKVISIEPELNVISKEGSEVIQSEDRIDWLKDFAEQLRQNQVAEESEVVMLPNIFYNRFCWAVLL